MNLKKQNDLEFLDTYWVKANRIASDFKRYVKQKNKNSKLKKESTYLHTIQYSDLNLWGAEHYFNTSANLQVLAEKIIWMVKLNRSDSIKRMIESIANNNLKTIYHINAKDKIKQFGKKESLGKGHFRFNHRAYILSKEEIKILKEYFAI